MRAYKKVRRTSEPWHRGAGDESRGFIGRRRTRKGAGEGGAYVWRPGRVNLFWVLWEGGQNRVEDTGEEIVGRIGGRRHV